LGDWDSICTRQLLIVNCQFSKGNAVSSQRKGITIVEVLVLLVIVVLVLGLLLSYLLRMREAAGQARCADNLRLIGEGIYLAKGASPHQVLHEGAPGPPLPASRIAVGYATWAVQLAPYVTANNPLADWDLRAPYADQQPAARAAVLGLYFCPARARPGLVSTEGDFTPEGKDHLPGGLGDYACASGDGDPRFPWDSEKANGAIVPARVLEQKGNLILRWQARTDLASLPRGLSNTILLGDKHVPLGKVGEAVFGDGSLYNGTHSASFARAGGPGYGLAQSPTDAFNNNFGSYHPRLCQFLMADDSVRQLANAVSEEVLGQLIRRE
jgi:type II secretory pathway pseudopilin PulG